LRGCSKHWVLGKPHCTGARISGLLLWRFQEGKEKKLSRQRSKGAHDPVRRKGGKGGGSVLEHKYDRKLTMDVKDGKTATEFLREERPKNAFFQRKRTRTNLHNNILNINPIRVTKREGNAEGYEGKKKGKWERVEDWEKPKIAWEHR